MRLRVLVLLVVLTALSGLVACGEDEPVVKVDLSQREEPTMAAATGVITYAYLPQYSHTVSFQRHRRLIAHLEESTGLSIEQVFPDTFDQFLTMFGQGEIDIAFCNPFIYVRISDRYGARAFARVVEPGSGPGFRGQVICRADNLELSTVADVRGKSWIAVDPASAGGYLFALGLFLEHGVSRDDFSEIAFAPGPGGKQEKVVLSVLAGKYEVGSIREGTLEVLGDKIDRDEIRVLAVTPLYPGWVYAAGPVLAPEDREALLAAMLALDPGDPEQAAILEAAGFEGVIASSDSDYDPVRGLIETITTAKGE